jgi:Ca2+/Na+ antiporter
MQLDFFIPHMSLTEFLASPLAAITLLLIIFIAVCVRASKHHSSSLLNKQSILVACIAYLVLVVGSVTIPGGVVLLVEAILLTGYSIYIARRSSKQLQLQ